MVFQRVLGVYAHPDDADVGAGASLARFAAQGAEVTIVVATLGDAGGYSARDHERITEIRRQEQLDAAAALGISHVVFLNGYRDGFLEPTADLVRDVVAQIRTYRPDLVLTMNPEHNWDSVAASHPDHRAIGEATVRAIYPAARNPFAYPELMEQGLEPWRVGEVWLQGHQHPNFVNPVAQCDVERKMKAVACHFSQFEDVEKVLGFVCERANAAGEKLRTEGRESGVPGAEGESARHPLGEEFLRYYA